MAVIRDIRMFKGLTIHFSQIATRHKHWNIARLLLQTNEVKVETDEQTKTPLMYAAIAGNYEIVVRLRHYSYPIDDRVTQ